MNLDLVNKLCEKCISEGESLLGTAWSKDNMGGMPILNPTSYVDLEGFKKWKSNCNVLLNLLGDLSKPWDDEIGGVQGNTLVKAKNILGALKSMKETIDNGYLIRIEDLIFAEAFSNLIEQAEYLYSNGYFLASGVLGRAVLEEKLRNLCDSNNLFFSKNRPTLNDFNTELFKSKIYDKIEFKSIDHLISIGNSAAHNKPINKEDVKKLIDGVIEILKKFK
ncbi:MAG: DUF4145 domain-containing protein [Saprospiraceae bacterium]|nr:DUF4145 domain-containing protein [Candidatus Defluviibacterium haderslevense]